MPLSHDDRIAALRRRCLDRKARPKFSPAVAAAESLRASKGTRSWQIRQGRCTRAKLEALPLVVDDAELLLGRLAPVEGEQAGLAEAREVLKEYPQAGGQTGHCALDLEPVFARGIDGLRDQVRERSRGAPRSQADVCRSFQAALAGLEALIERAARTAEEAMDAADADRRLELTAMAASCRRVAHDPPRTFRDAIQLLWLAGLAIMAIEEAVLIVPGRLDRVLRPFYEADLASGRLTPDGALELVECLYLLINEHVADGLAMSVMVGGRDADGHDVTCELSYLCLEALHRTRLIYPTVGVCWHEDTPPELVDLAVELISEGIASPALFGDETIRRGLRRLGASQADAANYINSTCVEITPIGGSNVWVASPYLNLCGLLLDEIAAQAAADVDAPDFESFLATYEMRLGVAIGAAAEQQNQLRRRRRRFGRKPLQSVFTRDCLAAGRDIDDGGALYNWVECSFVGLANLVDSLHVIRREVFEETRLTLEELHDLLQSDLADHEQVRLRWRNDHAKYGQQDERVDALVTRIMAWCETQCGTHRMEPDDSPFVPGCFCWVMHERLGRQTGATPDGREAHAPFADGGGPAQGRETLGPTAAVLSTTSWDHSSLIGGLAYNMRFPRSLLAGDEARAKLRDLILTYLQRGGFEVQVNVVDADALRDAREHPDRHRDLIVRIGGYCDYFTRLSEAMQEEILRRTEFGGF